MIDRAVLAAIRERDAVVQSAYTRGRPMRTAQWDRHELLAEVDRLTRALAAAEHSAAEAERARTTVAVG